MQMYMPEHSLALLLCSSVKPYTFSTNFFTIIYGTVLTAFTCFCTFSYLRDYWVPLLSFLVLEIVFSFVL